MKNKLNFCLLRGFFLIFVPLSMYSCASLFSTTTQTPLIATDGGESYRDTLPLMEPEKYIMYVPKTLKVAGSNFTIESINKNKNWDFNSTDDKTSTPPATVEGWVNPNKSLITKYSKSKGEKVKITRFYDKPVTETRTVETGVIDPITKKPITKQETFTKATVPVKEVFYGILEFHKIHNESKDDVTARAYYVNIADRYFEDAKGGNIAVLYEYYDCKAGSKYATSKKYTSWVLWLSDIPF